MICSPTYSRVVACSAIKTRLTLDLKLPCPFVDFSVFWSCSSALKGASVQKPEHDRVAGRGVDLLFASKSLRSGKKTFSSSEGTFRSKTRKISTKHFMSHQLVAFASMTTRETSKRIQVHPSVPLLQPSASLSLPPTWKDLGPGGCSPSSLPTQTHQNKKQHRHVHSNRRGLRRPRSSLSRPR